MSSQRPIVQVSRGMPASDGAGVKLTRIIASPEVPMVDPLLLLDCFESDNPNDYIAGFPPHPHRGFETVTYMLEGRMRHKDSAGNEGVIAPGGVQWMTAGRGIVHSEMPEQQQGLLKGFQLWVNLPAKEKMTAPKYQEYDAAAIPQESTPEGGLVRVIAGATDAGTRGPIQNALTDPIYLDVSLAPGETFSQGIPQAHNVVAYVIEGSANNNALQPKHLAVFGAGDNVALQAGEVGARLLLIAAKPLREPVARRGPFVMNTQQELEQAYADIRSGRFAA